MSDWGDPNELGWPGPVKDIDNLPETCAFKANRGSGPEYELEPVWYRITTAKLAFVFVFEHVVFGLTGLLAIMIPEVPKDVKVQIHRERLLEREILFGDGTNLMSEEEEDPSVLAKKLSTISARNRNVDGEGEDEANTTFGSRLRANGKS